MSKQARSSIRAQLLRLSLAIVAVSVAITLAGTLFVTLQGEQTALDNNLVNSASVLSQSPLLRQALEGEASRAELAEFLDAGHGQHLRHRSDPGGGHAEHPPLRPRLRHGGA